MKGLWLSVEGERAVSAAPSRAAPRHEKLTDSRQRIAKGSCTVGKRIVFSGIMHEQRAGRSSRERETVSSSHEKKSWEVESLRKVNSHLVSKIVNGILYERLSTRVLACSSLLLFQAHKVPIG